MSASLTISSASVSSSGKVVTVAIAGNSGSLTPASGVTGFRVRAGSNTLEQASATISGTTLTITLKAFAGSGQTVQIDTIAGNLADGSANTMVLSNAQAVTNNSTKTGTFFALTNAAVAVTAAKGVNSNFGRTHWDNGDDHFGLDILFTGTEASLVGYAYVGASFLVSVDGGAEVSVTAASTSVVADTSWTELSLASGLSEGTHRLEAHLAFNVRPFYVLDRDNGLKIGGASPALVAPTTANTLINPVGDIKILKSTVDSVDSTAYVQPDDNWTFSTSVYAPKQFDGNNVPTASAKFKATCDTIRVFARHGGAWSLDVDGTAHVAKVTPTGDFAAAWVTLATGLDSAAEHTYRVTSLSANNTLFAVQAVGGTGINTASLPTLASIAWYGDSISVGFAETDATYAHTYLSSLYADKGACLRGVAGSFVIGASTPSGAASSRTADILANIAHLERITILYGTNDVQAYYNSGGAVNTTYSAANFYTAYRAMIDALSAAGVNSLKIDCWGILIPGWGAGEDALTPSYNTQIAAAVADWKATYPSKAANMRYVDTTGFHPTGNVHPTEAESIVIANHWTPFITTPAYTITGPSTGTTGLASSAFTVALTAGLFNGTETITLSDGSNGGTFTPSVGSPGTSSVTVTPANNASSFTFTYTPATAGAKTITATNNATWNNPGTNALTAQSALVASAMFFAA